MFQLDVFSQHISAISSLSKHRDELRCSIKIEQLVTTGNESFLVLYCKSHLISSHLISSHLISSHLISSHLISSHLISSHLISSHLGIWLPYQGMHSLQFSIMKPHLQKLHAYCRSTHGRREQTCSIRPQMRRRMWILWSSLSNMSLHSVRLS